MWKAEANILFLWLHYPSYVSKCSHECKVCSGLFLALSGRVEELGFCWHALLWQRCCVSLLQRHMIWDTLESSNRQDASYKHEPYTKEVDLHFTAKVYICFRLLIDPYKCQNVYWTNTFQVDKTVGTFLKGFKKHVVWYNSVKPIQDNDTQKHFPFFCKSLYSNI